MTVAELTRLLGVKKVSGEPAKIAMPKALYDQVAAIHGQRGDVVIVDDPHVGCERCGAQEACVHEPWCAAQFLDRGTFRHFDDDHCFLEHERAVTRRLFGGVDRSVALQPLPFQDVPLGSPSVGDVIRTMQTIATAACVPSTLLTGIV